MTDREWQMIDSYLPHVPDPDLEEGEYYVMDTGGRVLRVRIVSILPDMQHDTTTYGVVTSGSGRHVDAGYGDGWHGFPMSELYDNRKDCRDMTHACYDGWERLRKLQRGGR